MAINPLISLQGRVPDIGQTFSSVLLNVKRFEDIRQAKETRQRQQEVRGVLGQIGQPEQLPPGQEGPTQVLSQEELIRQARQIDPEFANKQLNALGLDDPSKRAEASRFAAEIQSLPLEQQNQRIQQRVDDLGAQGRDPSDTAELLGMSPAQRAQALQGVQLLDLSTKERFAVQARTAKAAPGISEVQSSVILPDGTVQLVRKDGTVEIKEPGALGKELVRRGKERGVDLQQRRAQGRELGKGTAKFTDKTFETTNKLRSNNASLQQVIDSVRGGAETGPLAAKMPSFRAESIRLDQLRNQLGLDVIGSVTFGALSEGEMNLALSTALPTGLQGPDLIKWADDKITAQEKLAAYLEDQAIFLSQPGRSRADWIKSQREEKKGRAKIIDAQAAPGVATPPFVPTQTQPVIRFNRQGQRIQ